MGLFRIFQRSQVAVYLEQSKQTVTKLARTPLNPVKVVFLKRRPSTRGGWGKGLDQNDVVIAYSIFIVT